MGRGGESLNSSRFRVVDAVIGPSIVIASAKGIPENPEKAEEGPNCVPHDVNLRALGIGPLHGDFLDGNTPAFGNVEYLGVEAPVIQFLACKQGPGGLSSGTLEPTCEITHR